MKLIVIHGSLHSVMVKANEKDIKYLHNIRQRKEYSKKKAFNCSANIKKGEALSL